MMGIPTMPSSLRVAIWAQTRLREQTSDPFSQARPQSSPGPLGSPEGSHCTCSGSLRLLEP